MPKENDGIEVVPSKEFEDFLDMLTNDGYLVSTGDRIYIDARTDTLMVPEATVKIDEWSMRIFGVVSFYAPDEIADFKSRQKSKEA